MTVIETLWARRPWHDGRLKRFGFHLLLATGNSLLYRVTMAVPVLLLLVLWQEQGWGLARWLGLRGGVEWVVTLMVCDLYDYGWHRVNHVVPFLWRFHRTHHYDTHVDVATSLRFHIGELCLSAIAKCLLVMVWGPSLLGFALFETLITVAAQFHHANFDLGRAENVFRTVVMTPRLHAAHHTTALRSRDANYSTIFLWWDRLFGSFQEADEQELTELGLPQGRTSDLSLKAFLWAPVHLE
jgi:sterol desaturase/sphingolipid hydroxylase (fatty acid hydroxylase superfamily)